MPDNIFAELIIPGDILDKPNGSIVIDRKITEKFVYVLTDDETKGRKRIPRKKRIKIYNYD